VQQEVVTAEMDFGTPLGTVEAISTAVDNLLVRVFAMPAMLGRFARVCTLEGAVPRAPRWYRRMVFREPIGSRSHAFPQVRHTLEGHPPPGALEDLRLTLSSITGEAGRQESLFADVRRSQNLEEAMRQLRERLGTQPPIYHVREVEPWSRLPERRQALVPFAP
jgi:DNA polymerase-4/protein ImuB